MMDKVPLEIVIPIYNEGKNVIKLLNEFQNLIKTKIRVLLCYDQDDDNIFQYKSDFTNFNLVGTSLCKKLTTFFTFIGLLEQILNTS